MIFRESCQYSRINITIPQQLLQKAQMEQKWVQLLYDLSESPFELLNCTFLLLNDKITLQ